MKLEILDPLSDEDLRAVITRATDLLQKRDRERKDVAKLEATAILAKAGLTLLDLVGNGKAAKNAKPPIYRSGNSYQHPTTPALTWNAKGQKPNWVRELEKQGKRPIEIPAAANLNGKSALLQATS